VAVLTPRELLEQVVTACQESPAVGAYAVRTLTPDVLSVRVFIVDDSFIEVFHNAATAKTAYAWVREALRVYGKDNTRLGWHEHPYASPSTHVPCEPVTFAEFLRDVERLSSLPADS